MQSLAGNGETASEFRGNGIDVPAKEGSKGSDSEVVSKALRLVRIMRTALVLRKKDITKRG